MTSNSRISESGMERIASRWFAAAIVAVLCTGGGARADDEPPAVRIERVLAVEQADAPAGRYRIVFVIDSPIPAPRGAMPTPGFWLDSQPVRLAQDPRDRTTLFGYVDELPEKQAALRVTRIGKPAADAGAGPGSAILDARALLRESRPKSAAYEAAYIRRSADTLDLVAASSAARTIAVARFVRRDAAREQPERTVLTFKIESLLRGDGARSGQSVTFDSAAREHDMELGGQYLLFLNSRIGTDGVGGELPPLARIWWIDSDPVESFVRALDEAGGVCGRDVSDHPRAREFLIRSLSSPAAEVRRSAALALVREGCVAGPLGVDETARLRQRVASEPSEKAREAISDLLRVAGAR